MDAESSITEEVARLQQSLDQSTAKLEKQRAYYEHNLQLYFSMKAQESIVELQFESWKQLYRDHEAKLAEKHSQMCDAKLSIWRDREEFCDLSLQFVKHFSIDRSLIHLRRASNTEDSPFATNHLNKLFDPDEDLHSRKMAEIEGEIAKLKQKEVELDNAERELAPDEETVRRLQEALNNSASCLEETEAEIRACESSNLASVDLFRGSEVKSILKELPSWFRKLNAKRCDLNKFLIC